VSIRIAADPDTRAKAQGKTLGRPKVDEATQSAILGSLEKGIGIKKTAATLGCGIGTVIRVRNEAIGNAGAVAAE
jgi:DNA invertase Pin-like site-specific DNA recombinase